MFRFGFGFPAVAGGEALGQFWFSHGRGGQGGHRGRPHPGAWREEQRTRRGDIKFILLELLAEQPSHGYDLIKAMENRYGQFRKLSPGSVYPTLQMLEEGGYLTSEAQGGKRVYTITEAGLALLTERPQGGSCRDLGDVPPEFRELQKSASELMAIVTQVARSGNTEQMGRVRQLLDQVKREIYAMLSEP
jgi:DNA-binding PadR family transcriptional regulator